MNNVKSKSRTQWVFILFSTVLCCFSWRLYLHVQGNLNTMCSNPTLGSSASVAFKMVLMIAWMTVAQFLLLRHIIVDCCPFAHLFLSGGWWCMFCVNRWAMMWEICLKLATVQTTIVQVGTLEWQRELSGHAVIKIHELYCKIQVVGEWLAPITRLQPSWLNTTKRKG